jgi:hypothetical protein
MFLFLEKQTLTLKQKCDCRETKFCMMKPWKTYFLFQPSKNISETDVKTETVPETSVTAHLESETRTLHKTEDKTVAETGGKTVAGGGNGTRVPPDDTPEEGMETGEGNMWDLQQFVDGVNFAPQKHKQRQGTIEY